jgi:hypothetical protein
VVGYAKVQKLVNDYVVLKHKRFFEERFGEADVSRR